MKQESPKFKIELDRYEGDKAILYSEDGGEIILPKKLLPSDLSEGDVLNLSLSTDQSELLHKEKAAKEILNEILLTV